MNKLLVLLIALVSLVGCGGKDAGNSVGGSSADTPGASLPPVRVPTEDGAVVRGRAEYSVGLHNATAMQRVFNSLIPSAYAASSGSVNVTYTLAPHVDFAIDTSNFSPQGFTGDMLSLGSVALADIDDNHLRVCGDNGNQKCTQAVIRVYTVGAVAGFVRQGDSYGLPVYAGQLNPNTEVGLTSAGAVPVQTFTIERNKNRLRMSDFPTPVYAVVSDFSNAGSGTYEMNFVVEYVLLP